MAPSASTGGRALIPRYQPPSARRPAIRPEGDRLPQVGHDAEAGRKRRGERDQIGGHVATHRSAGTERRPVARSTRRSYSHGANARTTRGPSRPITTPPLSSSAQPLGCATSQATDPSASPRRSVGHWPPTSGRHRGRRLRGCRPAPANAPGGGARHLRRAAIQDSRRAACQQVWHLPMTASLTNSTDRSPRAWEVSSRCSLSGGGAGQWLRRVTAIDRWRPLVSVR